MIILNKKQLSKSNLRRDALRIIENGLNAIEIKSAIRHKIKINKNNELNINNEFILNLSRYNRIFIVGFGKGSSIYVSYIADIINNKLNKAIAIDVNETYSIKNFHLNKKVKIYYGTHPIPSYKNIKPSQKIVNLLKSLGNNDFVLFFISGGGSSLLCGDKNEVNLSRDVFKELTKKGAPIKELNIVRKHFSKVKGGWLSYYTYPAKSVSILVSDVPGNDIKVIASGPTVYDNSTVDDAKNILFKYGVKVNSKFFTKTPKDKKYFKNSKNIILASNANVAKAMFEKSKELGYKPKILSLKIQKEAKNVFPFWVRRIKKGEAFILAGESTVKILGNGIGGRNQESVLSVLEMAYNAKLNIMDIIVASIATDGYDNTPCGGAIGDSITLKNILKKNLNPSEYMKNNDSYNFFKAVGGHLIIKRNTFNVSDVMLLLKEK